MVLPGSLLFLAARGRFAAALTLTCPSVVALLASCPGPVGDESITAPVRDGGSAPRLSFPTILENYHDNPAQLSEL